jgi:phosphatidylglycerophosphate synthase
VRLVRPDPAIGLIIQVALLTILSIVVDLGVAGWVAGATYGVFMWAVLTRGLHRRGLTALGPANWVTLIRATLVGCVLALIPEALVHGEFTGTLVGIATVALVLDAVDGFVARRTGSETELGARFDMEVDAFLILVLSVYVSPALGLWVLAIGVMRYAYWVAQRALTWLRAPAPPRYWAKVVAAIQGIVLAVAAAGVLPEPVTRGALVVALVLLIESFGRDIVWLWLNRTNVRVIERA